MAFAQLLSTTADRQGNIITDGNAACTYQELPGLLAHMEEWLAVHDLPRHACLAIECTNTVPALMTLLYLLAHEYQFMLVPPVDSRGADLPPLPTFCIGRLTFKDTTDLASWPETALCLEPNPQYDCTTAHHQTRGMLFLRTSGSMGNAKIVVHGHTHLWHNAANCVQRFHLTDQDRVLIAAPIFHMYGLGAALLPAVMAGASVQIMEKPNIITYMDAEQRFDPNVAFLIPTLCDMFVQRRRTPRSYRLTVTAGQRIKEEVFRTFDARFGCLINLYGSTELGAIAATRPHDELDVRATTIGRPMPNVTARLDQASGDADLGELVCNHPHGFLAYVDNAGTTLQEAPDWFATGDLATIQQDGTIQILGRSNLSVNRNGYLVLFSDIEHAIETIDGVAQAVVVSLPAEGKRGQELAVWCVLGAGVRFTETDLRAACFSVLPNYAVPDQVLVTTTLPVLPSGKVDRQMLVDMLTNPDTM